ncbi:MAG TPA: caspase family protein, partial [Bacteroidia bacterium]
AQATRTAIENTLETLVETLTENDNVVIYYSGHGNFKKTMNKGYWVPVDAKTEAASGLISNNDIQTFLASIKTKHTLLISDACFSGDIFRGNTLTVPFEESEKYYSKVYNLMSRQALTSGGIEPVMDGGKDGHSVFAYYLLKNLTDNKNKYLDIGQLYDNLKVPVVNNSDQTPHLDPIKNTGDEGGQFIFIKK